MSLKSSLGLTLLEVLVALFILAFALTAIIKVCSQNLHSTGHLQTKTQASWVGLYYLNQARLGLVSPPKEPQHLDGQETFLGQRWRWQAFKRKTGNPNIQELHVRVFQEPKHSLITELTSYDYAS